MLMLKTISHSLKQSDLNTHTVKWYTKHFHPDGLSKKLYTSLKWDLERVGRVALYTLMRGRRWDAWRWVITAGSADAEGLLPNHTPSFRMCRASLMSSSAGPIVHDGSVWGGEVMLLLRRHFHGWSLTQFKSTPTFGVTATWLMLGLSFALHALKKVKSTFRIASFVSQNEQQHLRVKCSWQEAA